MSADGHFKHDAAYKHPDDPMEGVEAESHVAKRPIGYDELKGHRGMKIVQAMLLIAVIVGLVVFFKGVLTHDGHQPPEVIEQILPPVAE